VTASTFDDHTGYRGDDLTRGPLPYAELSSNAEAPLDGAQLQHQTARRLLRRRQASCPRRPTTATGGERSRPKSARASPRRYG